MGGNHSTTSRVFDKIKTWKWEKVTELVEKNFENEFEFLLNDSVIRAVTGFDVDDCKAILSMLGTPNGMISTMVFLMAFIILVDSAPQASNRDDFRIELCFRSFDFRKSDNISIDELMILILSLSTASNGIFGTCELSSDKQDSIIELFKLYFKSNNISKNRFQDWASEMLSVVSIAEFSGVFKLLSRRPSTYTAYDASEDDGNRDDNVASVLASVSAVQRQPSFTKKNSQQKITSSSSAPPTATKIDAPSPSSQVVVAPSQPAVKPIVEPVVTAPVHPIVDTTTSTTPSPPIPSGVVVDDSKPISPPPASLVQEENYEEEEYEEEDFEADNDGSVGSDKRKAPAAAPASTAPVVIEASPSPTTPHGRVRSLVMKNISASESSLEQSLETTGNDDDDGDLEMF